MNITTSLQDARILVVDAQPENLANMVRILSKAGYSNVEAFLDSAAGLSRFKTMEPDLVIVELDLPSPDGFDLIACVKAVTGDEEYLPVAVVTSNTSESARRRAREAGAHDVVVRPCDHQELVYRLEALLRTRQTNRKLRQANTVLRARIDEFEAPARRVAERRAQISQELHDILEGRGGMHMVFQPIFDLGTDQIWGAEALARFTVKPHRSPDEWFAAADEVGLGTHLELAALRLALQSSHELPSDIFLALNVSPTTVRTPALLDVLAVAPDRPLVLELTEHDRIEDYQPITQAIARLRNHGHRLAVDDTGSGYSSLQHIHHLSPDHIKLDRYFVTGIHHDPVRRALAAALVRFAGEIGADLIAEGIETAEELAAIRALGIRFAQGYHLARPVALPFASSLPAQSSQELVSA
jgi:EAL domain-containing protein (putative c-di-GMP-specific phosphodiesterase class I)